MRRIRSSDPGGQVQLEAGVQTFGRVSLTVPQQVAADLDVRKLLDRVRHAIDEYLRTVAMPSGAGQPTTREEDAKAGRTQYRWRTMRDDRVRPEHRVREGRVFAWASPPPDGDPGVPFGCRCHAEVYDDDDRRRQYRVTAIVGSPTQAGVEIRFRPHFIESDRWAIIQRDVIPPVVAQWLRDAAPTSGDGVATEPTVNLAPLS